MNIFVLGHTPAESARSAVDSHLNKQVLECFQMLAVAYPGQLHKKDGTPYGISHENHPLTKWVKYSPVNAKFCLQYAAAFANEFTQRTGTSIADSYPFEQAASILRDVPPDSRPTTYPLYVPEYIRAKFFPITYELGDTPRLTPDLSTSVQCYRLYYVLEKYRSMQKFQWSGKTPDWYIEMCTKIGRVPF